MQYNQSFRKVFDLDSAFNERASPRSNLFSNIYSLLDMSHSPFMQNRFQHISIDPRERTVFTIPASSSDNRIARNSFSTGSDEMTTATSIPVVHLPSTSSSDYQIQNRKSASYSEPIKVNSTVHRKDSEAEVDALTNILIKSIGSNNKELKEGPRIHMSVTSSTPQPYSSKRITTSNQQSKSTSSASPTNSLSRQSSLSSNECHRCRRQLDLASFNQNSNRSFAEPINGPLNTMFHQTCFNCYRCGASLNTDSFFYAQKRLLCSRCVHESLEKCTVCDLVINDRIIRVLGKPYHPKCFTCVACNSCLDGKAFTVDVHERMFCLEDFHKRYAPRCDACGEPIRPKNGGQENKRIISGNKTFHLECFGMEKNN